MEQAEGAGARLISATEPVSIEILGELRMDPFVNLHNCALDDEALAIAELKPVAALGGRTVVDPTCRGIGRDPLALQRISRATGLNIVMGGGFYLESSHPPEVAAYERRRHRRSHRARGARRRRRKRACESA